MVWNHNFFILEQKRPLRVLNEQMKKTRSSPALMGRARNGQALHVILNHAKTLCLHLTTKTVAQTSHRLQTTAIE